MLAVCAVGAVAVASGCGYSAVTATNNTYTGCLQGGATTNVAIGGSAAENVDIQRGRSAGLAQRAQRDRETTSAVIRKALREYLDGA